MKNVFSQRIRELRRGAGLSQEQLAAEYGVSVQAVSKWECVGSYPDIELLVLLAQQFGVSVDFLLRENAENADAILPALPDDGCLRVVQCVGQHMVDKTEFDPNRVIRLRLDKTPEQTVNVEVWGGADIKGDISGDVTSGIGLNCGNIGGDATAGAGIACGNIGGDATAGAGIECGNINGDATAQGGITCGNVHGDVASKGSVNCGGIAGDAIAESGDIYCEKIDGDATAGENIIQKK